MVDFVIVNIHGPFNCLHSAQKEQNKHELMELQYRLSQRTYVELSKLSGSEDVLLEKPTVTFGLERAATVFSRDWI